MKVSMKLCIFTCWFISGAFVLAGEYRYKLMVTTGLQEQVFDHEGWSTTILFADDSAAEARFVLSSILELGGVNGTKSMGDWGGVPFEQALILAGNLDPKVLKTQSVPNGATAEDYQKFTLKGLKVKFPLMRSRQGKVFDAGYIETHFSFDTLFPDGLVFEGKKVDFKKYTAKSPKDAE